MSLKNWRETKEGEQWIHISGKRSVDIRYSAGCGYIVAGISCLIPFTDKKKARESAIKFMEEHPFENERGDLNEK